MNGEFFRHTLSNGIRLIHYPVESPVAHCGIFINTGARDETDREYGMAHFIEHTIFKGTLSRTVYQILNRLENVGADLNAFTTKEETCLYATFLNDYYPRTLELFQDILFHSIFPEKEIAKEKQVVMDEIRSYKDSPADQIHDDFEDLLFKGHPLGHNILGKQGTVPTFTRERILQFIQRNYSPEEVVIASVGKIPMKRLTGMVTKYFDLPYGQKRISGRQPAEVVTPFHIRKRKRTAQVHCILGAPACSYRDRDRLVTSLLNNILGGPVMNSRLSIALRERNGITYHNESNFIPYSDSGLVTIYFGTDAEHLSHALDIVHKELFKLREHTLGTKQLHIVKKQFTGQLLIAGESNLSVMMALGKSLLLMDRVETVEEMIRRIDNVSAGELMDITRQVFRESALSYLIFH